MQKIILRLFLYLLGLVTLSFGIVLCVKCELGISPISSIPYTLSVMLPFSFGTLTMLFHLTNILLQYIVGRNWKNAKLLLQVPVAVLFGIVIDGWKHILSFQADSLPLKILLMCGSFFFTALGMHLMLSMKLVPNPPDGAVSLIAEKSGKETGTIKIIYDSTATLLSIGIGFLTLHRVVGFGIATILSALLVGRVLGILKNLIPLEKAAMHCPC